MAPGLIVFSYFVRSGRHRSATPTRLPGGLHGFAAVDSECPNCSLSQPRGSPHSTVPIFVPTLLQNRA
jgi:hypothetical protein